MASKAAIAVLVEIILAASLVVAFPQTPSELPIPANVDDFIQRLASKAVEDADAKHHMHLDYSVRSLKTVDNILKRIHDECVRQPNSLSAKALGSEYGAYVGEVIRRSTPRASWQKDDFRGKESYPLIWPRSPAGSPLHAYPFEWCEQRISKGEKAPSIWAAYSEAKLLASTGIM